MIYPEKIVYESPRSNPCRREHHENCIRDLGQCDCPCHLEELKAAEDARLEEMIVQHDTQGRLF